MSRKNNSKKRHTITIREKYDNILQQIINEKAGINSVSNAIEYALEKALIFLSFSELELYQMLNVLLNNKNNDFILQISDNNYQEERQKIKELLTNKNK